MSQDWIVTVDGSCIKNGRYGASAGYGVFWRYNDSRNECGSVEGDQKSGRAELTAVKRAINIALQYRLTRLKIRTDSQYAVNALTVWIHKWRYNGWLNCKGQTIENYDLIREIDYLMKKIPVRFQFVRGHNGDYWNEQADRMAKRAAKEGYYSY